MDTLSDFRRESPCPALLETLKTDCARCRGLCCTALYFTKSEGFPTDKDPGTPCAHLAEDFRCDIHPELRRRGLMGCMTFDCLGAGQRAVSGWDGADREALFACFHALRGVHQTLWYLAEAAELLPARSLWGEAGALLREGARTEDPEGFRDRANPLLKRAVALSCPTGRPKSPDLMGRRFKGRAPAGRDLSMCLLLAADLSGCVLDGTSLLGADLRDADLRGADLRGALFLTPMQLSGARGDASTRLPRGLSRPGTWG